MLLLEVVAFESLLCTQEGAETAYIPSESISCLLPGIGGRCDNLAG